MKRRVTHGFKVLTSKLLKDSSSIGRHFRRLDDDAVSSSDGRNEREKDHGDGVVPWRHDEDYSKRLLHNYRLVKSVDKGLVYLELFK